VRLLREESDPTLTFMWNVCWQCGQYRVDKIIELAGPVAICPECGHPHPFRQLPLLLVSGASGTGKSTVCQALLGQLPSVVLLDSDILWRPEFDTPGDQYGAFFETWLRLCKNIGQAGRPVVLFGAGVGVPANLDACVERRYFGALHYLALTCDEADLRQRLQQRPAWRKSHEADFVAQQLQFNQWFKLRARHSEPAMALIDTSALSITETVGQVINWIASHTASPAPLSDTGIGSDK
jgi:broad-specificity NMP kinase